MVLGAPGDEDTISHSSNIFEIFKIFIKIKRVHIGTFMKIRLLVSFKGNKQANEQMKIVIFHNERI